MLTANKILECVRNGEITITPFNEAQLNSKDGQPNSYDLKLDSVTKILNKYVNPFAKYSKENYTPYGFFTEKMINSLSLQEIGNIEDLLQIGINQYMTNIYNKELDTFLLFPNHLYLANTDEATYTPKHIPCLSNKSGCQRLGIDPIGSAGFGDIGFNGKWTLEISVKAITVLKKGMPIVQLHFYEPTGEITHTYKGKYQGQQQPTEGRLD